MRTAKTLIRLGGCPGWSESSLGAHTILLVLSWDGSNNDYYVKRLIRSSMHTPDSMDTLGPRGSKVVSRRRLCRSHVGNPHWPNATLFMGAAWNPHVGSTLGQLLQNGFFNFNFVFLQSFFSTLLNTATSIKMPNVHCCTKEVRLNTSSAVCG